MNLLRKIKLKLFILFKSTGFSSDYLERIYKIYLNHSKIIHWRDGFPVYSMATPALYSKPMAHFMARQFYRTIQNKNIPNLLSLAVNDDCNVACKHCSFFQGVHEQNRSVMDTNQLKKVIQEAQELGVSTLSIVGGEPTLRKDLNEIIESIDKDLTTVAMFTNGSVLAEKADSLRKSGLDGVYVSIDSADPEKHDSFRSSKGLFNKAIEGISVAKKSGLTVGISVVMTPEWFADGELDRMIELGKKLDVHEVIVFDAMPTGRFKHRTDLIDNHDWTEQMIKSVEKYNNDKSYPGILIYAYTSSHRSVGCSCGTSYCYVSPYGDMMSCDFNHAKFGNVLEQPFYKVWDNLTSKKEFNCSKWGGCKIKDSESLKKDTVCSGKGCSSV